MGVSRMRRRNSRRKSRGIESLSALSFSDRSAADGRCTTFMTTTEGETFSATSTKASLSCRAKARFAPGVAGGVCAKSGVAKSNSMAAVKSKTFIECIAAADSEFSQLRSDEIRLKDNAFLRNWLHDLALHKKKLRFEFCGQSDNQSREGV